MKLLLPTEVADTLRCSLSTVYALLESGKIVGHRCPGWRIKESDLEIYIQKTRQEPAEPVSRKPTGPLPRLKHLRL